MDLASASKIREASLVKMSNGCEASNVNLLRVPAAKNRGERGVYYDGQTAVVRVMGRKNPRIVDENPNLALISL